jgi:hypothetical protein
MDMHDRAEQLEALRSQLQQQDLTQQSESNFEAAYRSNEFAMPWEDAAPVYREVRAAQMQSRPRGLSPQQKADKLFDFLKRSGDRDFTLFELQAKALKARDMIGLGKKHMEQALKSLEKAGRVHCGRRERRGRGTSWVWWLPKHADAARQSNMASRAERYVRNVLYS